jgi:hypothetical protein
VSKSVDALIGPALTIYIDGNRPIHPMAPTMADGLHNKQGEADEFERDK